MINEYILVAEDDADDRYLMQTALEEAQFKERVVFVSDGVELLHHLEDVADNKENPHFPKLILLDLNMPRMDGREVLRKIKSHDTFRKIPAIVFSTTKNQDEVTRCYEMGANSYLVKPVSYDVLVETLSELCNYWFNVATLPDK